MLSGYDRRVTALTRFDRLAYHAQQLSFLINATLVQETARTLARVKRPKISMEVIQALRRRHAALHAADLANVEAGLYPRELLFGFPVRAYLRAFPRLVLDGRNVMRRHRRNDWKDLPPVAVDKDRFPAYYRRNFHWQTDGYFSDYSAEVYDLGVELLFRGTADVMRRQIIPPITRFIRGAGVAPEHMRLLDVGCGTGRILRQLATTHPRLRFHGVDLSPFYVRRARHNLADVAEVSLAVENGEALPYADATFDIVTSVYLFHELPRNARRNVIAEMARVVRPGGLIVIEDSAQRADSPDIAEALDNFPAEFHEPFFADYLRDDLAAALESAGLTVTARESHLVARVVVAERPA
jgi:ubiquinone/menaquinone biosynthesis C-methylase UbiE